MEILKNRKGARRMADISPDVLNAINRGQIATVNLVEYLAADLTQLLPAAASQVGIDRNHPALLATIARLPSLKPMQRHWAIAEMLLQVMGDDHEAELRLASHSSDLVRQWAAMFAGLRPNLKLADRLQLARPFAADIHFGVREIAWLTVRDAVAAEVLLALELLQPWTKEPDANLRRFASELTRPRGVWCRHLEPLKINPALGRPLLEPLQADTSRYVQDSVGNWLNDAAKSQPDWVRKLCQDWLGNSESKATRYICQRGMRSIV